jgi:hypothetical protein|tara:strand:- start:2157 stop:2531 length:375 start_codon:yes stop_codon:yes gene_type:complete
MAVTVTNQSNPLGSKVVQDTDAGAVSVDNATGASGILYAVEITNPNGGGAVYFKLADATSATVGTDPADIVLVCPASQTRNYVFLAGIAFSNGFSHWCVTGAAESNTTAAGSLGSDVTVRYVTN